MNQRSSGIEYLKAVAILLVFLSHVMTVLEFAYRGIPGAFAAVMTDPRYHWFGLGVYVVDFFFLLGGLQAGRLLSDVEDSGSRRSFLKSLLPLFLIQAFTVFLALIVPQALGGELPLFLRVGATLAFVSNFLPLAEQLAPVTWFLCVLVQLRILVWICRSFVVRLLTPVSMIYLTVLALLIRWYLSADVTTEAYLPVSFPAQVPAYYESLYMNTAARFLPFFLGMFAARFAPLKAPMLSGAAGILLLASVFLTADFFPDAPTSPFRLISVHPVCAWGYFFLCRALLSLKPGGVPAVVTLFSVRTLALYLLQLPALMLGLFFLRSAGLSPTPLALILVGIPLNLLFAIAYETAAARVLPRERAA